MKNLTLYGIPLSPFVRKTRLAMELKGVSYDINPVIPFSPEQPDEFKQNSPLGKIPMLGIDGEQFIPDSSAITTYLEKAQPEPALLPADPYAAGRAIWFEEYADTHMVSIIGGHLFAEVVLARKFFNREPNQEEIDTAKNVEIPEIFDYLEGQLSADYLTGDTMTLGDIAVASVFVNMKHAGHSCDAGRWPKVAAFIERMHGSELFASVIAQEQQMLAG